MSKYTHLTLNNDVRAIAGHYTPQKEIKLPYHGREVLYVTGHLVIDSSCCGTSEYDYAIVPGYIVRWQPETNNEGLPVSEVEPITDKDTQAEIRDIIQETEYVAKIDFW